MIFKKIWIIFHIVLLLIWIIIIIVDDSTIGIKFILISLCVNYVAGVIKDIIKGDENNDSK